MFVGNPGSGKTATAVREMALMSSGRPIITNIKTRHLKHCTLLKPDMIIKRELVGVRKKRDGKEEPVYEDKLNVDFWKGINHPIDIVIDEAHTILNSRRSMSKINVLMSDWLALLRRVIGSSDAGYGRLILISQLTRRLDVIAKDMSTQVRFFRCHYVKTCKKCGLGWSENNDLPEPAYSCPQCGSFSLLKHSHRVEVWHFSDVNSFIGWKDFGINTFHRHYVIDDIENFFGLYDTLQWDNMFGELY